MDETGCYVGPVTDGTVLGPATKTVIIIKQARNKEWITVLECISARGRYIKPTVIFKGKALQHQWFEESTPDWVYTTSNKGWIDNGIGLGWLEQVFIPQTRSATSDTIGRILVLDGHASHVDSLFMKAYYNNKIYYIYLPPYTSHVL